MIKNFTIKSKLRAGFGAIVGVVLIQLAVTYYNFERLSEARSSERLSLQVSHEAGQIDAAMLQIQSSMRGYLLTGDDSLVASLRSEMESARRHLKRTLDLAADNRAQQTRLRQLDGLLADWLAQSLKLESELRRHDTTGARLVRSVVQDSTGSVAAMRRILGEIDAEEARLLETRQQNAESLHELVLMLMSGGAAVCVLLAALIAGLLVRTMSRQLGSLVQVARRLAGGEKGARAAVLSSDELGQVAHELNRMAQSAEDGLARELASGAELRTKVDALLEAVSRAARGDLTGTVSIRGDDAIGHLGEGVALMLDNLRDLINNVQRAGILVTSSSTQIAAFARQQEATGVEQAQTSVEVLATTREISANTAQLLRTMEEAAEVAEYTTTATCEAQDNLKRMDRSMQQMVVATDSISGKLATLSEKASNINSVLATIVKVADQTNILSLNAAIEAEKAGEAGRGFAVVAIEIRRLADQTAVSTWDIEQMLKEMQSAVSASVMAMDKFTDEIRRSVEEMRHVAEQLSGMTDRVGRLPPRFDMVLQGMQSQAMGASQIAETMNGLSDASQQTVASLKATSEAVHQLKYAADNLQQSVATFSVNV